MTRTTRTTPTTKMRTVTTRTVRAGLAVALATALMLVPALGGGNSLASAKGPFPQKEAKPYALIFGTVWDKNDHPAYGIPVKIRPVNQKKAKWELMSNHTGEFAQRVPPGPADYVVWADIKTPKGVDKPQKTIHIENDERIDISLHLTQ